jgi:hypothetical protein
VSPALGGGTDLSRAASTDLCAATLTDEHRSVA